MCDMTHSYVWHDSFRCVTWLIHMCDMTHSHVTRLTHMCDMTHSYVWHDSFICVTWLIRGCDITYEWVTSHMKWVMSQIWMTHARLTLSAIERLPLIHMCDTTHSYVWHNSFISNVTPCAMTHSCVKTAPLIHMCDTTHSTHSHVWHGSHVWHDSFINVSRVTHVNEWS